MELILKYFPNLSEIQKKQLLQLQELYEEWKGYGKFIPEACITLFGNC